MSNRFGQSVTDLNRMRQHLDNHRVTTEFIETNQKKRGRFKWWLRLLGFFTCFKYLWIRIFTLFTPQSFTKAVQEKCARHYFSRYFLYRGLVFYKTSPFPKKPEKPLLILACRHHPMQSLFMYQLFDFPVLIPLDNEAYSFRIFPKLPLTFMGRFLKRSSYPDITLNNNWPEIKRMLSLGYSTIVYVNPEPFTPQRPGKLTLYEELYTLLQDSESSDFPAELRFLNCSGFEKYPWASLSSPAQIRCDLRPKEDVYGWLSDPQSVQEKLAKITLFFGAPELEIISKAS
jgi:hypothetical protein